MTASIDRVKVRAEHQQRLAFVDVRQSSPRQVRSHLESQRLQYGFAEQAAALGWTRERIVVLDEDQGKRRGTAHGARWLQWTWCPRSRAPRSAS
jgi:hypothetical protein